MGFKRIRSTSGSLLHARKVEDIGTGSKCHKNPPTHCCVRGRWRQAGVGAERGVG